MFRHIVVATDFSRPAKKAAEAAADLARKFGSKVTLLHAIPFVEVERAPSFDESLQQLRKEVFGGVQDVALHATAHPKPYDAVCAHARAKDDVDLIVVGRHGSHTFTEQLIGTTSERIVRHAPCSVLVTHHGWRLAVAEMKSLLVGCDLSFDDQPYLNIAASLADAYNPKLTLLHIWDILPPIEWQITIPQSVASTYRDALAERLEKLRRERFDSYNSSARLLCQPSPWHALCDVARDDEADMIVVGTHGHTGARRVLLGSFAEQVVRHAQCPVMVGRGERKDA